MKEKDESLSEYYSNKVEAEFELKFYLAKIAVLLFPVFVIGALVFLYGDNVLDELEFTVEAVNGIKMVVVLIIAIPYISVLIKKGFIKLW